jgi:hypothetical protein
MLSCWPPLGLSDSMLICDAIVDRGVYFCAILFQTRKNASGFTRLTLGRVSVVWGDYAAHIKQVYIDI